MKLAWLAVPCLVLACSDDSGDNDSGAQSTMTTAVADTGATGADDGDDDGGDTTTTGSGGADSEGAGTTSDATTDPGTTSADTSGDGMDNGMSADDGPDCTAPMDCESCFNCAVTQGPCMGGYDACVLETFCVPSLVCVQSMCTEDGLLQPCVDTCCASCVDLGTCGQVDPVVQCAQAECAEFCGPVSCP